MRNCGFKLFNDEHLLFSWHDTLKDAEGRQEYERTRFGREFKITAVTVEEWEAYKGKE